LIDYETVTFELSMSQLPRIRVSSENPHLLETVNGDPFFLLGDTAWELLHRLNFEEVKHYFQERKRQGFNMVWTNLLAEFDGLHQPDQYGQIPLHDLDPKRPNEKYFEWVDKVIAEAALNGLYVGLLPTWGDKVTAPWGLGPKVFHDAETAKHYATFLAKRYKDTTHLLWVLGGDRPPFVEKGTWAEDYAKSMNISIDSDWRPIWRSMAEGIQDVIGHDALITYHPQGGAESTSRYLHQEDWLHLNCMQSGHGAGRDYAVWELIERDYNLLPAKPTFDGEPCYEDHPVSPWPTWDPRSGYYDEYDVRRQIWRSVFAGGCGVVYGHHSIWGFASDRNPWINHTKMNWREAMVRPGAEQMHILKDFLLAADYFDLIPDQSVIVGAPGENGEHKRALRTKSGDWTAIYLPHGGSISVHAEFAAGKTASWLNPRNGDLSPASGEVSNGVAKFVTPNDIDWVLSLRS
jgi:hypothetical protein